MKYLGAILLTNAFIRLLFLLASDSFRFLGDVSTPPLIDVFLRVDGWVLYRCPKHSYPESGETPKTSIFDISSSFLKVHGFDIPRNFFKHPIQHKPLPECG